MHDHVDVSVARQNENGIIRLLSGQIQSVIPRTGSNAAMHGQSIGKSIAAEAEGRKSVEIIPMITNL